MHEQLPLLSSYSCVKIYPTLQIRMRFAWFGFFWFGLCLALRSRWRNCILHEGQAIHRAPINGSHIPQINEEVKEGLCWCVGDISDKQGGDEKTKNYVKEGDSFHFISFFRGTRISPHRGIDFYVLQLLLNCLYTCRWKHVCERERDREKKIQWV